MDFRGRRAIPLASRMLVILDHGQRQRHPHEESHDRAAHLRGRQPRVSA